MPHRDIDTIIDVLKHKHTQLQIEQLKVKHPGADDDGIWFFNHPDARFEVQLESSYGTFPFVAETDEHNERRRVTNLAEAMQTVEEWLGLSATGC